MIVKFRDTRITTWRTNADLSASSVRMIAKNKHTKEVYLLDCDISDATAGVITHKLSGELPVGDYEVEVEITRGDTITTAPSGGYAILCVIRDLQ